MWQSNIQVDIYGFNVMEDEHFVYLDYLGSRVEKFSAAGTSKSQLTRAAEAHLRKIAKK